jgi:hypothetical protein
LFEDFACQQEDQSALRGTPHAVCEERHNLYESIEELRHIAGTTCLPRPPELPPGIGTPGRPPISATSSITVKTFPERPVCPQNLTLEIFAIVFRAGNKTVRFQQA